MELLPQPLFGSARSFNDCDRSGYPFTSISAKAFLGELDPALRPIDTYEQANEFLNFRRDWSCYSKTRTAIERLILWAFLIKKKSILSLDRKDALEFIWFIQEPPETWLCERGALRFMKVANSSGTKMTVANPLWRPFTDKRLPTELASLYTTMSSCSAFYTHLVKASSILHNPFAELIFQQANSHITNPPLTPPPVSSPTISPMASVDWEKLLSAAERLAAVNPTLHERTLFLVACFAYLDLACSDFFTSEGNVITLGQVVRNGDLWLLRLDSGDITLDHEYFGSYFQRFCSFRGVDCETDTRQPLIPRVKGAGQVTRRTLAKITKDAVKEAVRLMSCNGSSDESQRSFLDAYKKWLLSDSPAIQPFRFPEIENPLLGIEQLPQPLFADYAEVLQRDGLEIDHPDTLLYLSRFPDLSMAQQTYELAKQYLCQFKNKNTYEAYRKYVERFLLWIFLISSKTLYTLTEIDLHDFFEFCKAPPESWVRKSWERRFIKACAGSRTRGVAMTMANPEWRPFWIGSAWETQERLVYHASRETSSAQHTVVYNLYSFLVLKKGVTINPLINRDSFSYYDHQKRAPSNALQGVSEAVINKIIESCIAHTTGSSLPRNLFIIYTIIELQLSRVDLRMSGQLLRFSSFAETDGEWIASLRGADGSLKRISVSGIYVSEVLLPYKTWLQPHDKEFSDDRLLFQNLTGGAAISDHRIAGILHEICSLAATDLECLQESDAVIGSIRAMTINTLARAPKPSQYLLRKALSGC